MKIICFTAKMPKSAKATRHRLSPADLVLPPILSKHHKKKSLKKSH